MNRNERGFTLLEAMIAIAVFSLVAAGTLSILFEGQQTFQSQRDMNRASEQARIAMDQIVRYLRYAGNDPGEYMAANGIPAVEILGPKHIRINSDFTGSIASTTGNAMESTGDPDGTLNSVNERVEFRYDEAAQQLLIDIGYGESVLADQVQVFELEFLDAAGNPTAQPSNVAEVKVELMATARGDVRNATANRLTLQSDVFLRSKTFNPFASDGGGAQ